MVSNCVSSDDQACYQLRGKSGLEERWATAGRDSWRRPFTGVASVVSWTYLGFMYVTHLVQH